MSTVFSMVGVVRLELAVSGPEVQVRSFFSLLAEVFD